MPKYVFPQDTRIAGETGATCIFFQANRPRVVPPVFEGPVKMAGGRLVETDAPPPQRLVEIAEVMSTIIALDDPRLLTESGMPRAAEIEKLLGSKTTRSEREDAWELIEEN